MDSNYIYHITTAAAWAKAQELGEYIEENERLKSEINASENSNLKLSEEFHV